MSFPDVRPPRAPVRPGEGTISFKPESADVHPRSSVASSGEAVAKALNALAKLLSVVVDDSVAALAAHAHPSFADAACALKEICAAAGAETGQSPVAPLPPFQLPPSSMRVQRDEFWLRGVAERCVTRLRLGFARTHSAGCPMSCLPSLASCSATLAPPSALLPRAPRRCS